MTADILLNVNQKDFLFDESNSTRTFFASEYGAHQIGEDENSYLDVVIPSNYVVAPEAQDIFIKAPYIPVATPIYIRFLRKRNDDFTIIKVFEENSLPVCVFNQAGEMSYLNGCSIMGIDVDGLLRLHCDGENSVCEVYKASDCDFNFGNADRQAVELMMECAPGKNYRYPITGVAGSRFMGSIIDRTSAAEDILRELGDDRQTVKDVYYDDNTQRLRISTDEYNNRQKVEVVDISELDTNVFIPEED